MTTHNPHEAEVVARSFTENGCEVTSIIYDPADAQQILYGTVTRDGVLVIELPSRPTIYITTTATT